jgi:hypothetical protein
VAYVYADGDTTYRELADEVTARADAERINLGALSIGHSDRFRPDWAFVAFGEIRVLPDGTQSISTWREKE